MQFKTFRTQSLHSVKERKQPSPLLDKLRLIPYQMPSISDEATPLSMYVGVMGLCVLSDYDAAAIYSDIVHGCIASLALVKTLRPWPCDLVM